MTALCGLTPKYPNQTNPRPQLWRSTQLSEAVLALVCHLMFLFEKVILLLQKAFSFLCVFLCSQVGKKELGLVLLLLRNVFWFLVVCVQHFERLWCYIVEKSQGRGTCSAGWVSLCTYVGGGLVLAISGVKPPTELVHNFLTCARPWR